MPINSLARFKHNQMYFSWFAPENKIVHIFFISTPKIYMKVNLDLIFILRTKPKAYTTQQGMSFWDDLDDETTLTDVKGSIDEVDDELSFE